MRKGLFVVGLVLLILGVAAAGLTFQQSTSVSVPQAPNASVVTLGSVTDGTMTVTWSGGSSDTWVNASDCSDSSCQTLGSTVGAGHGASGSFSFAVGSGDSYAVYATTSGVSATVQIDGLAPLTIIGIVLAALGAFVLVIGVMARPKVRPAPAEVAPPMASEAPMGVPETTMAPPAADEGGSVMRPPAPAPSTANPGQMIKCASCGTLNEMWLHNCRWCKRPLSSTSGSATA